MSTQITVHWDPKDKKGWHEYRIPYGPDVSFGDFINLYERISEWILESIESPYRHARWTILSDGIYVKFRYERNYLYFILRWS